MSAKKSKTFFKTLTAILVLLLFFGGYYIYSSGIFGASVTENISEHSITDEERLIEYEEYGITYDESSQSYLYQDSLIKNLRDGDFLYTNAAGSIKLIIQRDDKGTPSCRRPSQFSSINRKAASDCCLPQAYRPQNSSPIGTLRAPTGQKTRTVVPRIAVGLCINRLQSGDNVQ